MFLRYSRYGDEWCVRVRISGEDYRLRKLGTSDFEDAQEKAFEVWQSILREVEEESTTKISIMRLFILFIDNEENQVELGKLKAGTVRAKKSGIMKGILAYIAQKGMKNPKRINANKDWRE